MGRVSRADQCFRGMRRGHVDDVSGSAWVTSVDSPRVWRSPAPSRADGLKPGKTDSITMCGPLTAGSAKGGGAAQDFGGFFPGLMMRLTDQPGFTTGPSEP